MPEHEQSQESEEGLLSARMRDVMELDLFLQGAPHRDAHNIGGVQPRWPESPASIQPSSARGRSETMKAVLHLLEADSVVENDDGTFTAPENPFPSDDAHE